VNLDWAFLSVAPGKTFGWRPGVLTLNGGKFPNPMFRVGEMVLTAFRSAEGAGIKLTELCFQYPKLKLVAREARGGAIVFLHPE